MAYWRASRRHPRIDITMPVNIEGGKELGTERERDRAAHNVGDQWHHPPLLWHHPPSLPLQEERVRFGSGCRAVPKLLPQLPGHRPRACPWQQEVMTQGLAPHEALVSCDEATQPGSKIRASGPQRATLQLHALLAQLFLAKALLDPVSCVWKVTESDQSFVYIYLHAFYSNFYRHFWDGKTCFFMKLNICFLWLNVRWNKTTFWQNYTSPEGNLFVD